MAITATISASPSTVVTEQKCTAIVTISNSSAFPVNVTAMNGTALPTGASGTNYNTGVAVGVINTGPSANLTIGASGSLVLTFDLKFHGPSTGYLSDGANTYSVSAIIYTDDGSVTVPTATTVTVNYAITFPEAQQ